MLLVLLGSQLVCSQLNYSSEHVETEAHVYMYIYMQVHIDLIVQDSLTLLNGPLVFSLLSSPLPPIPPSPSQPRSVSL